MRMICSSVNRFFIEFSLSLGEKKTHLPDGYMKHLGSEAVPAKLMTTASGHVIGVGEVFGGGVVPSVAWYVTKRFGIEYIMNLGMGALVVGLLVALALNETAPSRITKPAAVPEAS